MVFRSIIASELELVTGCQPHEPVTFVDADRYLRESELRQYRPEWSWVELVDGRATARALWWGRPDGERPVSLDCLWVAPAVADPAARAAALLSAAAEGGVDHRPEAIADLAGDWRDDPAAVRAVAWREAALAAVGQTERNDRVSVAWTSGSPRPPRSTRLHFRPADDGEFLTALARVAQGSLDLETRRNLASMGAAAQAEDDLDFYAGLPGRRGDWRIAVDGAGDDVGLIIPSRSAYDASVSYLGVYPEHRGHGYGADLLAEITHHHADAGAPRITGTTDSGNGPMLAVFRAAGYRPTGVRIVWTAPG